MNITLISLDYELYYEGIPPEIGDYVFQGTQSRSKGFIVFLACLE